MHVYVCVCAHHNLCIGASGTDARLTKVIAAQNDCSACFSLLGCCAAVLLLRLLGILAHHNTDIETHIKRCTHAHTRAYGHALLFPGKAAQQKGPSVRCSRGRGGDASDGRWWGVGLFCV